MPAVAEDATDNDERWPLSDPVECDGVPSADVTANAKASGYVGRRFGEFLDKRANDVIRFASLGTTEQGESGSQFRVDYLKPSGAIGFHHPDWVVVQKTTAGEVNWIIETKGRVWEGTAAKDYEGKAQLPDWQLFGTAFQLILLGIVLMALALPMIMFAYGHPQRPQEMSQSCDRFSLTTCQVRICSDS